MQRYPLLGDEEWFTAHPGQNCFGYSCRLSASFKNKMPCDIKYCDRNARERTYFTSARLKFAYPLSSAVLCKSHGDELYWLHNCPLAAVERVFAHEYVHQDVCCYVACECTSVRACEIEWTNLKGSSCIYLCDRHIPHMYKYRASDSAPHRHGYNLRGAFQKSAQN